MASMSESVMEFVERLVSELSGMRPLLPTYIHLLISAIFPIYTAAHASLMRPQSAAPTAKTEEDSSTDESEKEEVSQRLETLTPSDAILFPVLAGTVLATLYFILKWLKDPALLNYYLGLYFAFVGLFFAIKFIKDGLSIARSLIFPSHYSYDGKLWKLSPDASCFVSDNDTSDKSTRSSPFPGQLSSLFQRRNSAIWSIHKFLYTKFRLDLKIIKIVSLTTFVDTLDLAGFALATPLVYYHTFVDKPWFLTNFLGFSFCYGSLQFTTPGTSWTGTLLLTALFFYDIYFVFFTPMMVTVATKLDVPIKLLFPRPDGCVLPIGAAEDSVETEEYLQCLAKKRAMAMLGLGDIVVPGMMLAFALRFDLYLYYQRLTKSLNSQSVKEEKSLAKAPYLPVTGGWGERFWTNTKVQSAGLRAKQFPKPYFYATVIGYMVGMVVTLIAMQLMQHAQPALLYLVPGVLISLWSTALVKGDLKTLWNYSEVSDEQQEEKEAEGKEDQAKNNDSGKKISAEEQTEGTETKRVEKDSTDNSTDEKTVADTSNPQDSTSSSPGSARHQHVLYFSLSLVEPRQTPAQTTIQKLEQEQKEQLSNTNESSSSTSNSSESASASSSDSAVIVEIPQHNDTSKNETEEIVEAEREEEENEAIDGKAAENNILLDTTNTATTTAMDAADAVDAAEVPIPTSATDSEPVDSGVKE